MQRLLVPDFDVYDAATWTAPVPMSHLSVKARGVPQQIPDFTRGEWRRTRSGMDSQQPAEYGGSGPDTGARSRRPK